MKYRTSLQLSLFTLILGGTALGVGCSPSTGTSQPGDGDGDGDSGDGDGDGDGDGPGGDGDGDGCDPNEDICLDDVTMSTPGACGGEERQTTQVPPDLLILLDRSGSMIENTVESGSGLSRWAEASNALEAALRSTEAGINWGLKLYPDDDWCGVSAGANVDVAPLNAQAIIDAYKARPPVAEMTHTPTRSAVAQGQAYIQSLTTTNPKGIVLVTDGEPNCRAPWDADGSQNSEDGVRDVQPPIDAVASAYAAGIPVYVVGFSISKEETTAALNNIAEAGGRAAGGADPFAPSYYTAENSAEFQAAMEEISADASTCTFELEEEPPASKRVTLYTEKTDGSTYDDGSNWLPIPEDSTMVNGWTYTSPTTIEIFGPECERVLNSVSETLKVGYDCGVR